MTQQVNQYLEEKVTFTQSWEHNQFWPGLSKGYICILSTLSDGSRKKNNEYTAWFWKDFSRIV